MWTIFKIFIEFVTVSFLFYVLVFLALKPVGSCSLIRDQTHTPCVGKPSLNH